MSGIRVRFACGHEGRVSETVTTTPVCVCGETRVVRTMARAPRFTGACSGPYAEMTAVEPGMVNMATAGPLKLKEQKE